MGLNPVEFIVEKREGRTHRKPHFADFFDAVAKGSIPDYQISAWLMAAFIRGLSPEDTLMLAEAIVASGDRLSLARLGKPVVDKHSTGGVGDKTSLVLLPLLASMGVAVPMMSGGSLGHTGGTVDKLESIPGMTVTLPMDEYIRILSAHGGVFMAQTPALAPLDGKLYAVRDVTGTVESVPLITASIIGKKATEDLDALILDVKFGNGAFMTELEPARALAASLVSTADRMGMKAVALLTDMNEPLGEYVGNAVEVMEAVALLKGEPVEGRFAECTMALAVEMHRAAFPAIPADEARVALDRALHSGNAFVTFEKIIRAQGVAPGTARDLPRSLDIAALNVAVPSSASGFVTGIDTYRLGRLMADLGSGRGKTTDTIDHGIGLRMLKHIGDRVSAGEPLAELMVRSAVDPAVFSACFSLGAAAPEPRAVVKERLE